MATTYTGNPTGVQSPDTGAAPGHVPALSIPSGTDAPTIESIVQWAKLLADYFAYIFTTIFQVFFVQKPSTGTDVPQVMIKDSAGNVRNVIDHLGYPGGRYSALREYWFGNIPLTSSAGAIGNTPWSLVVSGTTGAVNVPALSSTVAYAGNYLNITGGAAAAGYTYLQSVGIHNPAVANVSTVVEFELGIVQASTGNADIYVGLSNIRPDTPASNLALFHANIAAGVLGHWFAQTTAASVSTSTDTGVAATSGATFPAARFRLEFHGSGSPYGLCVRFFINEALVATNTTNVPTSSYQSLFFGATYASGTATNIILGPVTATFNRWPSLPAL